MLKYREIKMQLKEMASKMNIGDSLPSRPELCQMLDTTRATLDKAIKELVTEGALDSKNGSGTFVTPQIGRSFEASGSWGVIVPNIAESGYSRLTRGIENFGHSKGVNITLCNSDNNAEKQEQYINRLMQAGISGFVIVPVISNNVQENYRLYHQLTATKIPFVFCNRTVDGVSAPIVTSNDFYGGYIGTKHLLENGYRRIAFIAKTKYKTSVDRCNGYITALMEYGIPIDRKMIIISETDNDHPVGFSSMNFLLENNSPDAVFCFNDKIAQGMYLAINSHDKRISDEIGVIGYDNSELCETLMPRLTSLAYKNIEIGEKAAAVLWDMVNGRAAPEFNYYLFQPNIVVRDSCLGPKQSALSDTQDSQSDPST